MDIATLVTFNMYVASVQSPIRKLTQFTEQFTQGMAGFQRFRAIMHEDPDIVDAPDAVALTHVDGDIRFNDVSFSYDEGKGDVSPTSICTSSPAKCWRWSARAAAANRRSAS